MVDPLRGRCHLRRSGISRPKGVVTRRASRKSHSGKPPHTARLGLSPGVRNACVSMELGTVLSDADRARVDGTIQSLRLPNNDNMAPAGGISSSAFDMAQWVRLQLGGGAYQGQRLLSLQRLKELQSPNIDLDFSEVLDKLQFPADHFAAYGLGWVLMDYHARKVVFHTGSSPGFKAEILLVPEEHLGVVILSNFFDRPLSWLLGYRVIDAYLGLPVRDWAGEYLKALKGFEQENETEKKKREAERNRNTKPSLPMEKYAGRYTNEMYGEAVVSIKDGRTNLDFRGLGWGGELTHWQFDTFEAIWRVPGFERNLVTFMLGPNGDVDI